jgi:hypothetical protein
MKNEVFVSFRFADFEDITPDDITQTIGIEPTKIIIKDKGRTPKDRKVKRYSKKMSGF